MKEHLLWTPYRRVSTLFSVFFVFLCVVTTQAQTTTPSTETTVIDGKTYITHPIHAKDTYYSLSRIYGVPVKNIMDANNRKSLRVGDFAHIPAAEKNITKKTDSSDAISSTQETTNTKPLGSGVRETVTGKVLTEYKVGAKETLFSIARRFGSTVEDVKKLNGLDSDALKEGQVLKIPDGPVSITTTSTAPSAINIPLPDNITREEIEFETNRYGIREKKEKGIGIWMDNLEARGKSNLALHRTAPVGTILKITNPLTKSVTFAKVVGKFSETAESKDAIVILSKSAASYIGALDRRFLIEITYGAPVN
ncbi:MAG TPA: LysM peptidoglycan-binding domain-containing protein [Candidatus Sphingobacterium stercorigallinarum]|nr:LysM peptidoglycan-binding domain-containing protein [Candidatus Sphingobacterium stercorigallinarum]